MKYLVIIALLSVCYVCPDGNYAFDYKEGYDVPSESYGFKVRQNPRMVRDAIGDNEFPGTCW